jgi:uncharacterized protein YjdB
MRRRTLFGWIAVLGVMFYGCGGGGGGGIPLTGTLSVKSVPVGAKVFLNGVDTGSATDVDLTSVPNGAQQVRLEITINSRTYRIEQTVSVNGDIKTVTHNFNQRRIETTPASVDIWAGQTVQLNARAVDSGGNPIPGATFQFQSANTTVATVNSSGLVTGVRLGTTQVVITDTATGMSLLVDVQVRDFPPPPG